MKVNKYLLAILILVIVAFATYIVIPGSSTYKYKKRCQDLGGALDMRITLSAGCKATSASGCWKDLDNLEDDPLFIIEESDILNEDCVE